MFILPIGVCDLIVSIAPPSNLGFSDMIAWIGSHDGEFSIIYAYGHIARSINASVDPLFCLIWKWKGMERIRCFVSSYYLCSSH